MQHLFTDDLYTQHVVIEDGESTKVIVGPNTQMFTDHFAGAIQIYNTSFVNVVSIQGTVINSHNTGIVFGTDNPASENYGKISISVGANGHLEAGSTVVQLTTAEHSSFSNFGTVVNRTATAFRSGGEYNKFSNQGEINVANLLQATGQQTSFVNQGTLQARSSGAHFQEGSDNSVFINHGSYVSNGYLARFDDLNGQFINTGSVSSDGGLGGVILNGAGGSVVNSGTFTSKASAVAIHDSGRIHNSGELTSQSAAIYVNGEEGDTVRILNSGTIEGGRYQTPDVIKANTDTRVILRNTGEVNGDISLEGGADRIRNLGEINGDVETGAGDDIIFNSGFINGDIALGAGDDAYFGRKDGQLGSIEGGEGNDTLVGSGDADEMLGGADNDQLKGGNGDDTIDGGENNDSLSGGAGEDILTGGTGSDRLNGGRGADALSGNGGNDRLSGGSDDDALNGGGGKDQLLGGSGDDTLQGAYGDDTLDGGKGDDQLFGGGGRDVLNGGNGQDTISGGGGSDEIYASKGDDVLTGGAGSDAFIFGKGDGADTITDFGNDGDGLVLSSSIWGGGLSRTEVLDTYGTVSGGNYVLDFGDGDSITLIGAADLGENDLVFI